MNEELGDVAEKRNELIKKATEAVEKELGWWKKIGKFFQVEEKILNKLKQWESDYQRSSDGEKESAEKYLQFAKRHMEISESNAQKSQLAREAYLSLKNKEE